MTRPHATQNTWADAMLALLTKTTYICTKAVSSPTGRKEKHDNQLSTTVSVGVQLLRDIMNRDDSPPAGLMIWYVQARNAGRDIPAHCAAVIVVPLLLGGTKPQRALVLFEPLCMEEVLDEDGRYRPCARVREFAKESALGLDHFFIVFGTQRDTEETCRQRTSAFLLAFEHVATVGGAQVARDAIMELVTDHDRARRFNLAKLRSGYNRVPQQP